MGNVVLSVRVSEDVAKRIDALCGGNRSGFLKDAVVSHLRDREAGLTESDKRTALKGAKNISDLMNELILAEAANRKNFLVNMSDQDFAKLVAGRLPKEERVGADVEDSALTLQSCLEGLPGVDDVSAELSKAKLALRKAENECAVYKAMCNHFKTKGEIRELYEVIYRGAVEYCVDLVARRSLPGFGDGGGLTGKAYEEISAEVGRAMKHA